MKDNAEKIVGFMKTVEKLCLVNRDNLLSNGRQETDSDHIMKLAYLVMFITPYLKRKVDAARMVEMALVHDLVEAYSGDFSLSEQTSNPDLKEIKKAKEKEGIEHYKSLLPAPIGDKIYDLFREYECKETVEAKIVWCLDKLEANLQANRFNDGDVRYWADCEGGEWYYRYALERRPFLDELDEEILLEIQDIIIGISKQNMEKCGIMPTS